MPGEHRNTVTCSEQVYPGGVRGWLVQNLLPRAEAPHMGENNLFLVLQPGEMEGAGRWGKECIEGELQPW